MSWLRRNLLLLGGIALLALSLAVATWAEWHYFVDQAVTHGERPPGFWSAAHVHDWLYNAAMNWQSELAFGLVFVVLLNRAKGKGEET